MKITICGSMKFAKEMLEAGESLKKKGHEVTSPAELHRHLDAENPVENRAEKLELDVIRNYYEEIKKTDAVLVLNHEKNGILGYIGGNSLIEMAFAHALGKKVFLLNPVPEMSYTDEIIAMKPITLKGNLEGIE